MKLNKGNIICILITISISVILFTFSFLEKTDELPIETYQIYLDGEKIGVISDKEEFYSLINKEQADIRQTYNVDQIYPPKGFEIISYRSYNPNIIEANEIYDVIKNEREFTIKGYTIKIKSTGENQEQSITTINVLDKETFESAIEKFISIFVSKEEYKNYVSETQEEIKDVGQLIENMYFQDNITIRENYIGVDEKIYTNSDELARKLIYGDNPEERLYKVKVGDTLESIAFNNKLNVQELLIANDDIENVDSILAIGQEVNVALIKPMLSLVYDLKVKEIIEKPYEVVKEYDSSRYYGYQHVKIQGINGLNKITKKVTMVNGESSQNAEIEENYEVIREPQNKVIVYGNRYSGGGSYIQPSGDSWGLPTNFPYVVTSEYGYRWGALHDGIDISGTGLGSPIYAVLDGEVVSAQWGGLIGDNAGYNVVIKHPNGYYSSYSHMCELPIVKVGDFVEKGQQIGKMGMTGWADGVHVHLSIFTGVPYHTGTSINPRKVILF